MKKRFSALSLALFVLFGSVLCVPFPSVRADGVIDDLVYYALTVSGYMGVQYNSGGGSHSFGQGITATTPTVGGDTSKTLLENLRDAFQYAYDNHNISVDASGNYVFDSTVTNQFYNIIQGSGIGGYDAKYFDGNPLFTDTSENTTLPGTHVNNVASIKNTYSDYIYIAYYNINESTNYKASFCTIDASNIAYCVYNANYGNLTFYDSNNSLVSVDCTSVEVSRSGSGWSPEFQVRTRTGSSSPVEYAGTTPTPPSNGFSMFPYIKWNDSYGRERILAYTTNKIIPCGSSEGNARGAYLFGLTPSYVTINNYNTLPSVPGQTVQDTNFRETYAQYVNNVNNTYNSDNQSWNPEIFRTIAKDQSNLVINAINQGVGDITGAIESLEDKVQRILNVLNEIRVLLASGGGSGGSGGGLTDAQYQAIIGKLDSIINGQFSPADLDPVLSELSSIDTGVGLNRDQLLLINNKLVQIYNALVTGNNSPNNPQSDNYTYGDNYYINNETDINNDLDILGDNLEIDTRFLEMPDLLRDVVPFCFVVAAGTLINKLAADPEPPHFEIPFSIPAFGIDETIVIDFSDFEELHTILTAGFSILFVVGCMYLEFKLLDHIYRMMS